MPRNPLLTATSSEDMLTILQDKDYKEALRLHTWAKQAGLKIEPRTGANYYRIQYSIPKPKRTLFTIECNEKRWRVKSPLHNFAQYCDTSPLSPAIKKSITATRTCTKCNTRCIKGSRFSLDGKDYFTCIGSGHFFEKLSSKDWQTYLVLLQSEYKTLTK